MVKVTFTLDEATIEGLEAAARSLARPKSQVVRDAIRDYADRLGRLSERERRVQLNVIDRYAQTPAVGSAADVDRELAAIRASRRAAARK